MSEIQLAIFDLDGTILNTLEDLYRSTNAALEHWGYPPRTLEEVRQFVGNGIGMLIRRAVPAGTTQEGIAQVHAYFLTYYGKHCADTTQPYDGILPLIQALRQAGIRTAVSSNKADAAVQQLIDQYFPGLFDAAVGERTGIPRKPAPDSVVGLLDQFQISPEQAVYIGDSEVDVATAHNAGVPLIAVDWGFRGRDTLVQAGAERMVSTPDEVLRIILA